MPLFVDAHAAAGMYLNGQIIWKGNNYHGKLQPPREAHRLRVECTATSQKETLRRFSRSTVVYNNAGKRPTLRRLLNWLRSSHSPRA